MDAKAFKRNPKKVKAACVQGNDGSIVALKPSKIYIPERFLDKQLASIGKHTYTVGIFAHVVDDAYAVFLGATMVELAPSSIATVKFGQDSYLEFGFEKGAKIIMTQDCVMDKILTYRIYDEILSKGKVPWYMGYDDKIKVLFTADKLAGVGLMKNHAMLELNAAATCRDPEDINQYYRHWLKSFDQVDHKPPINIPLMNVVHGTTNTVSKLMGSYWDQGIASALVNPTEEVENIEALLRQ